jgi:cell wall-associated NlpC family hydrolase
MKRADVIAAARSFIGTPFHHQGRAPGIGLDCVGVVVCAGRAAGDPCSWDHTNYGRVQGAGLIFEEASKYLVRSDPDPHPGDVLIFALDSRVSLPQHSGILTEAGTFVHARFGTRRKIGPVEEREYSPTWRSRTFATFRYPGFL